MAEKKGLDLILSDGTPGIAPGDCVAFRRQSGGDRHRTYPSGRHDLERVADLCAHFRIPAGIIINKCDLNEKEAATIEKFAADKGIVHFGSLPHDPAITRAMINGQAITEYANNEFTGRIDPHLAAMIQSLKKP
ncbi:MAG: hypothetical protein R2875_12270 [Desulfobacterales bacterium]